MGVDVGPREPRTADQSLTFQAFFVYMLHVLSQSQVLSTMSYGMSRHP